MCLIIRINICKYKSEDWFQHKFAAVNFMLEGTLLVTCVGWWLIYLYMRVRRIRIVFLIYCVFLTINVYTERLYFKFRHWVEIFINQTVAFYINCIALFLSFLTNYLLLVLIMLLFTLVILIYIIGLIIIFFPFVLGYQLFVYELLTVFKVFYFLCVLRNIDNFLGHDLKGICFKFLL